MNDTCQWRHAEYLHWQKPYLCRATVGTAWVRYHKLQVQAGSVLLLSKAGVEGDTSYALHTIQACATAHSS